MKPEAEQLNQSLSELLTYGRVTIADGCWVWMRGRGSNGYGTMKVNGKTVNVHRLAYELANGPIPCGLHICHTCDNPPCINPNHLFAGTRKDNMRDSVMKGRNRLPSPRYQFGEANCMGKLSFACVQDIRVRVAAGEMQKSLAREYGISKGHVSEIVRGKKRAVA